jgi:trimeric autotransporter adhesin
LAELTNMAQTNFTPISLYYSATAAAVPTAGNLVAGELAINTADGKLFYKDSAGVVQVIGTKGGVGSSTTTQVLYNSSGLVVGDADFTFNGTTVTMANDASISGLTVGKGGGAITSNTVVGSGSSLAVNTTGTRNVVVGTASLQANTTGGSNTVMGVGAMFFNTTGTSNTAIGDAANQGCVTANNNTAVGFQSLTSNTAGNNTAVGMQAGLSNTTGNITAVGYYALRLNSTGTQSTAVGVGALADNTTGNNNAAVGHQAMNSNTTGASNCALGLNSLLVNTTGSNNVAIGQQALAANTTASNNTAVGYQAGYSTTTTGGNTYLGYQAGYSYTTGSGSGGNTMIGNQAGYNNTSFFNTFVGLQAGLGVTTGSYNTFVGVGSSANQGAGYLVTTGAYNTIIGGYSGNQGGVDIRTSNNNIVLSDGAGNPRAKCDSDGSWIFTHAPSGAQRIMSLNNTAGITGAQGLAINLGANTSGTNSYPFIITTASNDKLYIYGNGNIVNINGSYGTLSDIKLKENIVDATPKLNKILQLKVRNFNLKTDPDQKQIGFIAQEFEQVFPSMIDVSPDKDNEGNDLGTTTKSIKTSVLVPILVKAIQELKAEVDSLKQQINGA